MNEREIIVSEADIAVDGFLYQLQLTPSSFLWNLKYLQLRNGTLVSFKNENENIIVESIPSLSGFNVAHNSCNEFAFYSFTLFSSDFSLTFTALNEDYTRYWVNALSAGCKKPPSFHPHPPFATLSQSQKIFDSSPLPPPFSSLRFDCSQGIAQIVDSWLGSKVATDPLREAFSSFDDILQYRYASKKNFNNALLFDFAITRQFNKMRTLLISSRKNNNLKSRFDYFSSEELCLFLFIIMGEEEGVSVLLNESKLELTNHMGGFTPLLFSMTENKPYITKLLVDHSHDPVEIKKLINHKDMLENSKDDYINQLSSFLEVTRKVDPGDSPSPPHSYSSSSTSSSPPSSSSSSPSPATSFSPFYHDSPVPISPLDAPSFFPLFPFKQPPTPSIADLRLLQLVTSFQIPRGTILSVIQSLLNSPDSPPEVKPTTSVTETDAYRTLKVSGLTPNAKHTLLFKLMKQNAHSSDLQVANKGEATTDSNGVGTWKLRSYVVCDIEMHVEGSSIVYSPFTCRFTSRKKGQEKTRGVDLDMNVAVTAV